MSGILVLYTGTLPQKLNFPQTASAEGTLPPHQNPNSHFESRLQILCTVPLLALFRVPKIIGYSFFICLLEYYVMSSGSASDVIRVLVADSNRMQSQLLSSALRRHPEFHLTSCPMDVFSILQAVVSKSPRVVLLSLTSSAKAADTVIILRRVHLSCPEVAKVLLVDSAGRDLVVAAFRSGARGIFCISDANLRLLCKCILRVASGQIWANTEQLSYLIDLISEVPSLRVLNANGMNLLTPREEQVVALVAEGLGNRHIAHELNLSEHTVKKYLFRIFEKLGVSTRVELVLYAMNNGAPRQAEWVAGSPARCRFEAHPPRPV